MESEVRWDVQTGSRPTHSRGLEAVEGCSGSGLQAYLCGLAGTPWFGAGVKVPGPEPYRPGLESSLCHLLVVGF